MNIDNKQVGKALRSFRVCRGMTQADLAQKAGMTPNNVARLERGEIGFSVKTLNALARTVRVPASFLTIMGTVSPGSEDPPAAERLARVQTAIATITKVETRRKKAETKAAKKGLRTSATRNASARTATVLEQRAK